MIVRWLPPLLLLLIAFPVRAETVHAAVASNFLVTFRALTASFEAESGHRVLISSGSTGKLYAQIKHGAPYELFLAADAKRPRLLEEAGLVKMGDRFVYAVGRLVLWSPKVNRIRGRESLNGKGLRRIALANPAIAPYGRAAREALTALALWEEFVAAGRFVYGENVAQAQVFSASGNTDAAFVSFAQIQDGRGGTTGSHWPVPIDLYTPIRQEAVLLARGSKKRAAHALFDFLRSVEVRKMIRQGGYESP